MTNYGCTSCGWLGDECDREDHYPQCPDCGKFPLQVYNPPSTEGNA